MPGLKDLFRGAATPRLTRRWKADIGDHVISLAWSPKRDQLAVAAVSGPITLFDTTSGQIARTLSGHGFGTADLAWRPDGTLLASAGQDGKVKLWDPATGTETAFGQGGASWVEHVTWSPKGEVLASAAGKKLRLWSPAGQLVREFADHAATISDLAWRPRTAELTSATYGGVRLWRPESTEPVGTLEWKGSVLKLAWSPTGDHLAHGNQDATVHYWVMKTGEDLQMAGYASKVRDLCWDPTGTYLATGGGEAVTVWNCSGKGPENTEPLVLEGHKDLISGLTFQAKGALLASAGLDGKVFLYQPGRYKKHISQAEVGSAISQLHWSGDDQLLGVGAEDGTVAVYGLG